MIECPFCLSELPALATACRSCGHDLSGQIYLLRRLHEVFAELSELRARVEAAPVVATATAAAPLAPSPSPPPRAPARSWADHAVPTIARLALLPGLLLLLAHHVLVFGFDLSPVWLMLTTLLVPVPFGVAAILRSERGLVFWSIVYLVVAVLTILLMDIDTAASVQDFGATPAVLPASPAEWWQEGEFAAGLYLSFLSGLLASLAALRAIQPEHPKLRVSRVGVSRFARSLRTVASTETIERAAKYLNSLGVIASMAGAILLAVRRL